MLLQASESIHAAQVLAGDYKFWVTVGGIMWGVYKAYDWVKQIRTKDVPDIKEEVKKLSLHLGELGTKVDNQTNQVVQELKEMRSDFRTFYCAPQPNPLYGMQMMQPVHAKPIPQPRKKRNPKPTETPTPSES